MLRHIHNKSLCLLLASLLSCLSISAANACTRVLFTYPNGPVLVGNNMDWFEDLHTDLLVYPRGKQRSGNVSGNELKWTSKYGSIVATAYDELITTNGMNERGLAAHMLGLNGSDYGTRNEKIPGISIKLWIQYYLDNFQTVAEAVKYTQSHSFQIVSFIHPKAGYVQLHLALEDATGDSAIIEYINGEPRIYHDRQFTVVTNSPSYDKQLENLKQYAGFGGDKPLPGTTFPADRFVRAAYYISHMSEPQSNREAVLKLLSVMQNAGQPYGTLSPERSEDGTIYESLWRTVSDLTNHIYYFNSTMSFNIFWVSLDKFNLTPGAPTMRLNLTNKTDLVGDVSTQFD